MPFVFSEKEMYFHRSSPSPALGLCASFCCKEAVFKALRVPYNFVDCQFLCRPDQEFSPIVLAARLRREAGISEAVAVVRTGFGSPGNVMVAAYLY